VAQKLANRLGLLYISGKTVVENIVKHSFHKRLSDVMQKHEPASKLVKGPQPMIFSEEFSAYLRSGRSIPKYLFNRALDLVLMEPK